MMCYLIRDSCFSTGVYVIQREGVWRGLGGEIGVFVWIGLSISVLWTWRITQVWFSYKISLLPLWETGWIESRDENYMWSRSRQDLNFRHQFTESHSCQKWVIQSSLGWANQAYWWANTKPKVSLVNPSFLCSTWKKVNGIHRWQMLNSR